MSDLRIPFEEAISEPRLLRDWFYGNPDRGIDGLSFAQQTVLLAIYGCELDTSEQDARGFTRLDYWYASQGYGRYDDDGFLTAIIGDPPLYIPQEYNNAWIIAGVRGGKSDRIAATAVVYEAVCGGHEGYIRAGKLGYCLQVCQDLRLARESLHGIEATLKTIPFLSQPLHTQWSGKSGERIGRRTANFIRLWNGMAITTMPPTVKAIRGYDAPVGVLDEVGIWPTADEAANVDKEVFSQIKSRQAQFNPQHRKVIGISSPWIMAGLLYEMSKIGTKGRLLKCAACERKPIPHCKNCERLRAGHKNTLVCHFTTAALGNPLVSREWLTEQRLQDSPEFERECLAIFQSSAARFLPAKKVEFAVDKGILERAPIFDDGSSATPPPIPTYVAALDPAFRQDSFGFGIGHMDEAGRVVIDVIREWVPAPGHILRPEDVLDEIGPLLEQYSVVSAASDQNSFDALNSLAMERGFALDSTPFTGQSKNDIYGNLYTLFASDRIRLLDNDRAINELKMLNRIARSGGGVSIEAPANQKDDLADVIALVAKRAMFLTPAFAPEQPKPKTIEQQCEEQIARRRAESAAIYGD